MSSWKLVIEDYGKIEHAEIEVAPLTLFIGDNNSGKSYLLSLIWAILSESENNIIFSELNQIIKMDYPDIYNRIMCVVKTSVALGEKKKTIVNEDEVVEIINSSLEVTKDNLVRSIFNYEGMSIGKIQIKSNKHREFILTKRVDTKDRIRMELSFANKKHAGFVFSHNDGVEEYVVIAVIRAIAEYILNDNYGVSHYLPAARTGFMLAKNTINQVGRKKTFDVLVDSDAELDMQVSPFPKTIIHFLNAIDNLDFRHENSKRLEIVEWIEANMVNGDIEADDNNDSIQYIPKGRASGIPLRATSGVVTELAPLVLLLKHHRYLNWLCYEEPEMCLHPQLQLKMAELLIYMVNRGINIVATTHSDIIIQHINNMCQLAGNFNEETISNANLDWDDVIRAERVAIYQFDDKGELTTVERILPENNVFMADTFVKALETILEKTLNISDIVDGEVN